MGLTSRFITYGVWGYSNPGAYAFTFDGANALRRARKRAGALKNLVVLGDGDADHFALCLAFRTVYQSSDNIASAWTADDGSDYLAELPSPFEPGVSGLAYEQSLADEVGSFYSTAFQVAKNEPWALKFLAYKPPEGLAFPVVTFTRGQWCVMVSKSRIEMMKRTADWTQTQENTLITLLGDTSISSGEQATIDTLRALIYTDITSLDLPGELYGEAHELVFIPQPHGVISVRADGSTKWQEVKDTAILATRKDGVLWPLGPVLTRSNGIALEWQVGRPQFATDGQLRLGQYQVATSGDWTYSTLSSTPNGTTVSMVNESLNVVWDEVKVDLATTNTNRTPFFYAGHAYRAPAVRSGYGVAESFDTDDLPSNPIQEITPNLEATNRRGSWQIRMKNVNGATTTGLDAPYQFHYPAFEHLIADLFIDGVCVVRTGIVKLSGHADVSKGADNLITSAVMKSNTSTAPMICDQWAILDEIILNNVRPVGDGRKLGAYIRELLGLAGLHPTEYAGVIATQGRHLPSARPGEGWLVIPAAGCTLGDWLRHLLELYGSGRQLWIDSNGVWQFNFRSTTTKYTFTTGSGPNQIFDPLDLGRDVSDHFNHFVVEGAEGKDGLKLCATWTIWNSIKPSGGPGSLRYIGRYRPFPPVRDDALVTQSDCDYAVRTLATLHGKPGRFMSFEAWYRADLYPGDWIVAHGKTLEVMRVESGSIAFGSSANSDYAGKMAIVGRERDAPFVLIW